jgi:hypothetical protein
MNTAASAVKSSAKRTDERVNDWTENQSKPYAFLKAKLATSSAASKMVELVSESYYSFSSHFAVGRSEDRPNTPEDS